MSQLSHTASSKRYSSNAKDDVLHIPQFAGPGALWAVGVKAENVFQVAISGSNPSATPATGSATWNQRSQFSLSLAPAAPFLLDSSAFGYSDAFRIYQIGAENFQAASNFSETQPPATNETNSIHQQTDVLAKCSGSGTVPVYLSYSSSLRTRVPSAACTATSRIVSHINLTVTYYYD